MNGDYREGNARWLDMLTGRLLTIKGIAPQYGSTQGGILLNIEGEGFTSNLLIKVGDKTCENITIINQGNATCTAQANQSGKVDIILSQATLTATLKEGFTYYDPMTVSPLLAIIASNNTSSLSVAGGVPPYQFSSNLGSVTKNGGFSSNAPGIATITVTDAINNSAQCSITVNQSLQISPSSKMLAVNNTASFVASGGVPPYNFSTNSGAINSSGVFTAPNTSGSTAIAVTDSIGNIVNSAVTINAGLSITPTSKILAVNNTTSFSTTGGVPPYVYSSTIGSINSNGVFTAPANSSTGTITVTDTSGNSSSSAITVNQALSVSPTSKTVAVNNSFSVVPSGGVSPYSFGANSGSVTQNGNYTAPSSSGNATITVTDAVGNAINIPVTVNATLTISPLSKTLAVNNSFSFSASGGVGPYSFSADNGSITNNGGVYTAPTSSGTANITVTDSLGNTSNAAVVINPALTISPLNQTIPISSSLSFSASGGVGPYEYSKVSGLGSIIGSVYTSGVSGGSVVVRVTDSIGNTSDSVVSIQQAGYLDSTFGNSGQVIKVSSSLYTMTKALNVDSQGRILIGLGNYLYRFNSDGSSDSNFASNGTIDLSSYFSGGSITDILVKSNDNLVVSKFNGLIGVTSSGSIDASFSSGSVQMPYIAGNTYSNGKPVNLALIPNSTTFLAASNWLTCGSGSNCSRYGFSSFTTAGVLTNLGNGTTISTDVSNSLNEFTGALLIPSSSNILLAGQLGSEAILAKYTSSGGITSSFGLSGYPCSNTIWPCGYVTKNLGGTSMFTSLQHDNNTNIIYAAGTFSTSSGGTTSKYGAIVSYNSSGDINQSFGINGQLTFSFGTGGTIYPVELKLASEKFYLAGIKNGNCIVYRATSIGLDNTFGVNGSQEYSVGSNFQGCNISIQSDGKILIAGPSANGNLNVLRVLP